ncbi:ANTAR domain-containing protein [Klenkia marina]|uniref:ANTAR domain-containing protein n=1 Tax=Klenkia marina TaxID=1960309 RepID=UPI001FB50577|nr:ANTAR domain-containing protein [Klenkia marina]
MSSPTPDDVVRTGTGEAAFVITRTTRGWAVLTPAGTEQAPDLVEAMSLADLIAEDLGASPEPGRDVRRAARGPAAPEPGADDPRDQELAALRRTVGQLEHALATRVSTERAIGVLAAVHATTPRAAFEQLRRDARASGRPVHDLAREVLDGLVCAPAAVTPTPAPDVPPPAPAPSVESVADADRPTRRRVERGHRRPALVEGDR